MAYTVKQLAGMSGVSVRTLHFYDEAALLKPAKRGANGYRFYEEAQLLTLQQILFYRRLGIDLKQIKKILSRPDFNKIAALESHRKVLRQSIAHNRELIRTVDKTIEHLKGINKVKSEDLFVGFSPEEQARHEQYLIDRFGEPIKECIAESKARVKNWTKDDWQKAGGTFDRICRDIVTAMGKGLSVDSPAVQEIVRRHYQWLKQFWTPNSQSYAGHSLLIGDSPLRKAYEGYDPRLPEFAAAAIRVFAQKELG
jgi:DNA-binding transcriptional MerR regulator